MKKVLCCVSCLVVLSLLSIAFVAVADELPEFVKSQVRKGSKEFEGWSQFDKSGPVKFLQVQHTAAASDPGSAATLDGSFGERLIEVVLDSSVKADLVTWSLKNKGPGTVTVVASNDGELTETILIEADASAEISTKVVDAYCYIVVDSEGKNETTLSIQAKAGEEDAKTVRGKSMLVAWF
ncbi:hypothetical protein CSB45_07550 [candidate division KSB3 bacterium]|uniref:Uncharacterized protein n=1 Tax=candidate division KSB3 bacterium TaxID=2044937 RepID=A0A2G6E6I8_9BACT|nr:MAG: hypothetical protein CSB45_07550 [candidate division KSB3 bacterium]PIE29890.1 MAG: hypothetical protein CSA57_06255 [candidate division KSB3 bacterium]